MINSAKSVMLIWLLITAAFGQTVHRSFSFDASVAHNDFKIGSPIVIEVQLKNISDHDIMRGSIAGYEDRPEVLGFRPVLRDDQGKEPPLTNWGRRVFGRPLPGEPSLTLNAVGLIAVHPGEVFRSEIKLNDLYDLTAPGKYTVHVTHYDTDNKELVSSKPITFTISK